MSTHVTRTPDRLVISVPTKPLDTARRHLSPATQFLNQVEARDQICRVIQFTSKFISNGNPGVAHNVDTSTALARKVFRLLKSVNEVEYLLTPFDETEDFLKVFLCKSVNGLMATYFLLDNLVWAGTIGIYKNSRFAQFVSNISMYFFLGGCMGSSVVELLHLVWKKKAAKRSIMTEVDNVLNRGQRLEHDTQTSLMRLARSSLDMLVGIGFLGLAPKQMTPRITGACGTMASLIASYELYQATTSKVKIH